MRAALVYRGRYHIREALDLETLASVLRQAGHEVQLFYDPDTFGVTDNVFQWAPLARRLSARRQVAERVARWQPEVALFSVLATNYAWCRETAAALKRQAAVPVVFFGLHPSLVPRHAMGDPSVDYVVAGEVEGVADGLLQAVARGEEPREVGNLWYRREGAVRFTHRAALVDLDALPLPDKDLFAPLVSHRASYCAMVSRGCPCRCTFCEETCASKLYDGHYFRRKSVETVMRELSAGLRKYGFREAIFKDSYLSGSKPWLREFAARYRAEIGVPFKCFCTIAGFDAETAALLKGAGCYAIEFGLQTWNDRIRRDVLQRRETSDDAFRAFALCDAQRLRYDVDHMFCLPGESADDHAHGAECYRKLRRLGRIKVHHLVYYPTAEIVDHALAAGDLPPDAPERLAEGLESDFYDRGPLAVPRNRLVAGYAALYKVLPLLPQGLVRWLARPSRAAWLARVPSPVIVGLQGLNALRTGDLRFAAYLRIYPRKIFQSLLTPPRQQPRSEPDCEPRNA